MSQVPFANFGCLDAFDVPEKYAAHVDILWFLVIVEMVGAVALLLPFVVALIRAGCLYG